MKNGGMERLLATLAVSVGLLALGVAVVISDLGIGFVLLTFFLSAVALTIGTRMATEKDPWWKSLVVAGWVTKLIGSSLRYWVLVSIYIAGDASGYHGRGIAFADYWRSFDVPPVIGGIAGTPFMTWTTSVLYIPYEPSFVGGFFEFATLSFMAQLLFYASFRRAFPAARWKPYAYGILFLPSVVFWPSSIGKESLVMLGIAIATYGSVRLFERYSPKWILVIMPGLLLAGIIRIHMAALVAGAIALTALWTRTPKPKGSGVRRAAFMLVGVLGLGLLVNLTATEFDFTVSADEFDLDALYDRLERQTGDGGSAVEGEPIRSIQDIPQGVLRVLYRPFPWEATNEQALLSAAEGTVLLIVTLLRFPAMVRGLRMTRRRPYFTYTLLFTAGFVMAFSTFLNLGLMARQRSIVLPFLLVLLVAPGAEEAQARADKKEAQRRARLDELAATAPAPSSTA